MNGIVDKLVSTPVLNGAIMAAAGIALLGSMGQDVPVFGVNLPAPVVDFGLGVASSLVADTATNYVLPQLTKDEKVKLFEAKALNPIAAGIAFVGLRSAVLSGSYSGAALPITFALSAGSELGAIYAYDLMKGMMSKK